MRQAGSGRRDRAPLDRARDGSRRRRLGERGQRSNDGRGPASACESRRSRETRPQERLVEDGRAGPSVTRSGGSSEIMTRLMAKAGRIIGIRASPASPCGNSEADSPSAPTIDRRMHYSRWAGAGRQGAWVGQKRAGTGARESKTGPRSDESDNSMAAAGRRWRRRRAERAMACAGYDAMLRLVLHGPIGRPVEPGEFALVGVGERRVCGGISVPRPDIDGRQTHG